MNLLLQLINTPLPLDAQSPKQYWRLRAIRGEVGGATFQLLKAEAGASGVPLHRLTKWQASKVIAASEGAGP